MNHSSKIKVAYSQRIIPHYRVPVFVELTKRKDIDFTAYYGKGFKTGSQSNAKEIAGFKHKKLFTIFLSFNRNGAKQMRSFHPTLFFHLLFGNYDVVIVEPSTNFYNDIFVFLYCKLFRKKFIWYEVGAEAPENRTRLRKIIDPFITIFTKFANCYITYNSFADKYLKEYYNVPTDKIFRAQNALDTKLILKDVEVFRSKVEEKRTELKLNKCKIALFIGGVEKRKRINNLITAIYNLNKQGIKSRVLVVGDGPDLDWVKDKTSEKEKDFVLFLGKHITDAVLYILLSDVVVLPAQGGLSINHAFACGKPFIGTQDCVSGGTSIYDYVRDGYNGYVVEINNIKALEEKLKNIFTDDKLYKKLCEGAIKTSKKITIPNLVDGIESAIYYAVNNS